MGQEVTREREQVRASVAMTVRYSEPAEPRQHEGVCQNLSSSGMFLGTPRAVAVGTVLKIDCELSDGSGRIHGVARVVWVRGEAAGEGRPAGMGLRFLKLESGSDALIQDLLARGDLGTSGRRARSDPPGERTDSQRPRLVAVAAIREVGSGEAGRDKHSSNPPPGRKSGVGELRERWKNTRRQIKSDPPAGGDASQSEPPRITQPEGSPSPPPPRTTVLESDFPNAESEARRTEPSGSPGPYQETIQGDSSSDPEQLDNAEWRAKRLAELVEIEAEAQRRGHAPGGLQRSASQLVAEEGVVVRGPLEVSGALIARVAIGLLVVLGVVALTVGRTGRSLTDGPAAAAASAPHIVPAPAQAPPRATPEAAPTLPAAVALPRGLDLPPDSPESEGAAVEAAQDDSSRGHTSARTSSSSRRTSRRDGAPAVELMPTPTEGDVPATSTPLETALACLKVGDSACAVKALEGKANSAREWELLVESHRALRNVTAAESHMREYLERFPQGSMRETYRRLLEYRRKPDPKPGITTVQAPASLSPLPEESGPRAAPPPADPALPAP